MGYMTDSLTFNTLRSANQARLPAFKNKHGLPAHSEPDGSDWSPAQWLQAMVGEIGEYANFRKKFERGDITEAEFQEAAAKELADVQIYLDLLAFRLGIDLGRATLEKFNEVSLRVHSPIHIRDDGSDWRESVDADTVRDSELEEREQEWSVIRALILHRVNAHDALVSALREASRALCELDALGEHHDAVLIDDAMSKVRSSP